MSIHMVMVYKATIHQHKKHKRLARSTKKDLLIQQAHLQAIWERHLIFPKKYSIEMKLQNNCKGGPKFSGKICPPPSVANFLGGNLL